MTSEPTRFVPSPLPARRRGLRLVALALLVTLASACWYQVREPADVSLADGSRLEWVPCWFDVPWLRSVDCARLHVAPRGGGAGGVELPVVVFRDSAFARDEAPVLYLAGGPGGSAWLEPEYVHFWFDWVEQTDLGHDVIVFDQRGTGLGTPRLDCPEVLAFMRAALQSSLPPAEGYSRYLAAARRCHRRLKAEGHDLARYTTAENARDVAVLMEALGAQQWNLYGVSYGTRLAMEVMRSYPRRLRSVVLDSAYPFDVNFLVDWPWLVHHALERIFDACARDPECVGVHGDPRALFPELLRRLRRQPVTVAVDDPQGGESVAVSVNDERLVDALFSAMYDPDLVPAIPRALDALVRGNPDPLRPLVENLVLVSLDETLSDGTYLSVECHDQAPVTRERYLEEVARYPLIAPYVADAWDFDPCREWESGRVTRQFRSPVRSEIPTLVLAGEFDPITPPRWGERVARDFVHGHLVVLAGAGHGVVDGESCASEVVRRFLAAPREPPAVPCATVPARLAGGTGGRRAGAAAP